MMAAATANAQALGNQGFPGGLSGLPGIPSAAQLLAALISKIVSMLGIPMVAHSPCGMHCLLAMVPIIPCPIALATAAKKAAQGITMNPPVSFSGGASATGSASAGASASGGTSAEASAGAGAGASAGAGDNATAGVSASAGAGASTGAGAGVSAGAGASGQAGAGASAGVSSNASVGASGKRAQVRAVKGWLAKSMGVCNLICFCKIPQMQLLAKFQNLPANLNFGLNLPPGLPNLLPALLAPGLSHLLPPVAAPGAERLGCRLRERPSGGPGSGPGGRAGSSSGGRAGPGECQRRNAGDGPAHSGSAVPACHERWAWREYVLAVRAQFDVATFSVARLAR